MTPDQRVKNIYAAVAKLPPEHKKAFHETRKAAEALIEQYGEDAELALLAVVMKGAAERGGPLA